MHSEHQEPNVKVEEVDPAKFSLQIAGWVWGVSLVLVLGAAVSGAIRIFASFLLIPLLLVGVPIAASVGIYYGLKGRHTAQREQATQGVVLNAAACAVVVIAALVVL